jgi:hypothetical protein
MSAIQEQHARPDMDGLRVVSDEVVIETCEQQLLDARVARVTLKCIGRLGRVCRDGIRHQCGADGRMNRTRLRTPRLSTKAPDRSIS